MKKKTCSKCNEAKSLDGFGRKGIGTDASKVGASCA
jgi:hypothetical protein